MFFFFLIWFLLIFLLWNRGDSPIICNCSMESAIILFFSETLTNLVGVNDLHGKVFQIKRK